MFHIFKSRWFWVTSFFAVINIVGLLKIASLVEKPAKQLQIEFFSPQGEVHPDVARRSGIVIRFNQPMVVRKDVDSLMEQYPVLFTPSIQGRFRWDDPETIGFYPTEALHPATHYRAVVLRDVVSLAGGRLPNDEVFEFNTPGLRIEAVHQITFENEHRATLAIDFSDAVSSSALRDSLRLTLNDGRDLGYTIREASPNRNHIVTTDPVPEASFIVKISKGLCGTGGPIGLAEDVAKTIDLDRKLVIHEVRADTDRTSAYINVSCSQGVKANDARSFVRIDPPADYTMEDRHDGFALHGNFVPSRLYRVTLLKGLPSSCGIALHEDVSRSVLIPDRDPEISFKTRGIYLSSQGNLLVPIESVNVANIEITIERLYDNNLVYYLASDRSSNLGVALQTRTLAIGATFNRLNTTNLDLRSFLNDDVNGLFLLTARDAKDRWVSDRQVVSITDTGITVKKAGDEMVVWTNSLSTAQSLEGVKIAVFTRTNQKIVEGVTDRDGLLHLRNVAWNDDNKPFAVTATKGKDVAFLQLSQGAIDVSSFDIGGRDFLAQGYEAFLFTDRGVYRPGEKVHLKAIVRSSGPGLPGVFPLTVAITRPDGLIFQSHSVTLSNWGSAETEIALPSYALTGRYQASVALPGNKNVIGTVSFSVEEFVPNRMKVEIEGGADRRYRKDEKLTFTVKANYLFGAPATGRIVEARCDFAVIDFSSDRHKEFRFTDGSKKFAVVRQELGSGTLDEKGEKSFTISVPEYLTPPSALAVIFTAAVKEVGGRTVTASVSRTVDYYPFYIGLSKKGGEYGEVGHPSQFVCVAVRADGTPLSDGETEATVYKVHWNYVLKMGNREGYRYESIREEKEVEKQSVKIAGGSGSFSFTPQEVGEYEIRVREIHGLVSANLTFHCAGFGYAPWARQKPEVIELVADKKSYAPGETARIILKSPFAGRALVTIESTRIHLAKIIEVEQNSAECAIPIEKGYGPNVYCSVTMIRGTTVNVDWTAHRAFGVIPLRIDAEPRRLSVKVDADETARPGTLLPIKVHVRDSHGAGARAEVTIAAVDEGICQLTRFATPDPWAFFYAKRRLATETSDAYSLLMPEIDRKRASAKSSEGGDGNEFDPRLLNPISVERFKPVALWKSSIVTGEDGRAETEISIPPEFTGQLRLMVIASAETAFGSGERPLFVKQPLMIQASFPRVLSPGDEFSVPVVIFNNTGKAGSVRVRMDGSDRLTLLSETTRIVEIGDGREAVLNLRAKAPEVPGSVTLSVMADLGNEEAFEKASIAVRPPATLQYLSGSGTVAAGTTAQLILPDKWVEGSEKYSLSFSSLPVLKLGNSIRYLLQYPYGCVEQTTSKAFPLLYMSDILKVVDPDRVANVETTPLVQSAIDRLLSMQTRSGGFAMWPGYTEVYPWGSVYATHFMVEAKRAGYAVPADALGNALHYLDASLSIFGNGENDRPVKAYACMVLAAAGKPNQSWTRRLYEEREWLPSYSRFHVAATLSLTQSSRLVSAFLAQEKLPDETPRVDTGGILYSSTREAAILLSIYLDIDPANPNIPILVRRLENALSDGRWGTTQENGFALMALGKYLRTIKPAEIDYKAVVMVDGKELTVFASDENIRLTPNGIGGKKIEIAVAGKGLLYYYWSVEAIPLKAEVPEKDNILRIRRSFFTRKGEPLDLRSIPHGELVVVNIEIKNDIACDNVVISDLLPAGFEIENPRIVTSETLPWLTSDSFSPDRVEMRDDRLLIFAKLESPGVYNYRYLVRAVTRGRFELPPVSGFCMYNQDVSSVHGRGEIEIK